LCVIGASDLRSRHNVLRIYPVIGHLRFMLEFVRPELRQYFFESEQSGRPFNREQRTVINARADDVDDTSPFGTLLDVDAAGFDFIEHSMAPKEVPESDLRLRIGGAQCSQPYESSRLNISAMSFGSLSGNAVRAMNLGAKLGGFAQDTGEGGISPYHLEHGGDLVWELGTAYFGCRTRDGRFDAEQFREQAGREVVKMVEVKLSQGAKPSHGGLLPAAKINPEIARTRGVAMNEDCLSPAAHPEFSSPAGLLEFVARLRELCGGKPVGFKLCLGRRSDFMGICKAMLETGIRPDFIVIDGAEGGTGAAPLEFSDFLGTYINEALPFVHSCLAGVDLRDDIRVIASGKVAMGFDMLVKMALGADMCNAARPFMFSVGCIQARRCHTNTCPTGVATQDPVRAGALDPQTKAARVRNFHRNTLSAFRDLVGAIGVGRISDLNPGLIYHRVENGPAVPYDQLYPYLERGALLEGGVHPAYAEDWNRASADRF
jgi:glutamate synthase domain-containing protein 2